MKRAAAVLLGLGVCAAGVLAGCGSAPRPPASPPPPPAWESVNGAAVLAVPRSTGDWAELSLWIDAGARDGSPSQLASAAAWAAADAHGGEVDILVLADATRIRVTVPRDEVSRGLDVLRDVLAARNVSQDAVAHAIRRVQSARSARTDDPADEGERRALGMLTGNDTAGWDPLGRAEDDGALTAAAINAFLARHYGPTRALFIAAGELTAADVRDQVRRRTAGLTPATGPARAAPITPEGTETAVISGSSEGVALAVATDRMPRAVALAHGLTKDLGDGFRARIFGHGGRPVVILRRDGAGAGAAVAAALPDVALWLAEHHEDARLTGLPTDAWGADWASRSGHALPDAVRVVVTLADDSERSRAAMSATLEDAAARAKGMVAPSLHGDVDSDHADVTLDSGARIRVVRRDHDDTVALAFATAGGAGSDAPREHGLAAALAQAMTLCDGDATADMTRAGATMHPWVTADHWGMILRAPAPRWLSAAAPAMRCATRPRLTDAEATRARLATLAAAQKQGEMRPIAAALLHPQAPGLVAPQGDAARLADLHTERLASAFTRTRTGAATTVTVVGPVDPATAATFIARRLLLLPPGSAPTAPPAVTNQGPRWLADDADDDTEHAVLAWQITDPSLPSIDGQRALLACGSVVDDALRARRFPSATLSGTASVAQGQDLWLAASLSFATSRDAEFQTTVAALRAVATPRAVETAAARAARTVAVGAGDPATGARAWVSGDPQVPFPHTDTVTDLCRRLLASPVHVYVARPQ